jgi:hypothetical protein
MTAYPIGEPRLTAASGQKHVLPQRNRAVRSNPMSGLTRVDWPVSSVREIGKAGASRRDQYPRQRGDQHEQN